MLFEEEAVGAGDGQQIDVGIETHGSGDHRRVPVSSWAMPPESATRRVGKPRVAELAGELGRSREVRDRSRKVAIRIGIREAGADERHDRAEVDAVAPFQQWVRRRSHLEKRDATAGPNDARQLGEERVEVAEVAQRKAARGAIDIAVTKREPQHVGAHAGHAAPVGAQHAFRQVDADGLDVLRAQLAAKVAGTGR